MSPVGIAKARGGVKLDEWLAGGGLRGTFEAHGEPACASEDRAG